MPAALRDYKFPLVRLLRIEAGSAVVNAAFPVTLAFPLVRLLRIEAGAEEYV
jgi:hypothetical protein